MNMKSDEMVYGPFMKYFGLRTQAHLAHPLTLRRVSYEPALVRICLRRIRRKCRNP